MCSAALVSATDLLREYFGLILQVGNVCSSGLRARLHAEAIFQHDFVFELSVALSHCLQGRPAAEAHDMSTSGLLCACH